MASLDFPSSPTNGQTYSSAGITWTYDSTYTVWNVTSSGPVGYSGSQGYTGSKGDIGYSGSLGYTGSAGTNGTNGYNGSQGYTGSASTVVGYTGSKGDIGYTGSAGTNGTNGYTGSAGTTGYTGSLGYSGSAATINWMYKTANYTAVNNDGILADTTSASFTVTLPASPATGTYVSIVDVTSTFATNPLTVAGNGQTLQGLTYTSVVLNVTSAKVDLIYEGAYWAVATTSGTRGYTGSSGVGYTGSASTVVGYTGSLGYVGSQGYNGSAGYTGSVGYTGSLGYTGSKGDIGYTGSIPAALTATSLALGGATLGAHNLAVTGTSAFSSTVTHSGATTLSGALTYGGVTLSNAVTGTGNMVLSASPTLTGTLTAATANFSGIVAVSAATSGGQAAMTIKGTTYSLLSIQKGSDASSGGLTLMNAANTQQWFVGLSESTNDYVWYSTAEKMRITTAGLVGIGMTPSNVLDITQNQNGESRISILNSNGGVSAAAELQATNGTHAGVLYQFGTGYTTSGILRQDGTVLSSGSSAGGLTLATFSSSPIYFAVGLAEVARFDTSGSFLVGLTASSSTGGKLQVDNGALTAVGYITSDATQPVEVIWQKSTSGNGIFTQFFTETSITLRGSITYNRAGGLVAYNTTSDYRSKELFGAFTGSGDIIDRIPVHLGKMIGATERRPMFVAHEVQEGGAPWAVMGTKDAVDKNKKPVMQQLTAIELVPILWAEMQSVRAELKLLKSLNSTGE